MVNWKLFWVESNGYENCFIVARDSHSAKEIEIRRNGFNPLDVNAFQVMKIPDSVAKEAEQKFKEWSKINAPQQANDPKLEQWPWYADTWLLKRLGAQFRKKGDEAQVLFDNEIYAKKISPGKKK